MTENVTDTSRPVINRIQMVGLVVGVIAAVLLGIGYNGDHFYQSYLMGWILWNGIALGFLGLLMLHHMVGGEWGYVNRRIFEAGAMTLIVTAIMAVPLLLHSGMEHLYIWTHEDVIRTDSIVQEKLPYLNAQFFLLRFVLYYAIWFGMAFLLNRWSADVDKNGSPSFRTKARYLSGPGIVIYVLLYTFYAVDMLMSLQPHWFSTIFALMLMVGAALSTLSLTVILMYLFKDTMPLASVINKNRFWDIGNLMLAFTMLWAYMAFSQYLISWAGNLEDDSSYYVPRITGGFKSLAVFIVVFHFAIPFFLLLQRAAKKAPIALSTIGLLLIVMRYVDLYWIVKPAFEGLPAAHLYWTDIVAPFAFGGIWLAAFAFFLKSKPILPVYETHHDRAPIKSEVYTHG